MLKAGWKNSIRLKNDTEDHEGAEMDLRMIRMGFYDRLDSMDKFFVSYCLAYYNDKNEDFANKHLKDIEVIFEYEDIRDYQIEYHKYLWLKVNVNHKKMTREQIEEDMMKVYEHHKSIGSTENSLMALGNMYEKTSNGSKLLDCFKEVVKNNPNIEKKIINDFLINLKKMDEGLYIKGLSILNYYRDKKIAAN